jgi:hypothetical protein
MLPSTLGRVTLLGLINEGASEIKSDRQLPDFRQEDGLPPAPQLDLALHRIVRCREDSYALP